MYETLNQRLTHGSTSIFRDPNIQTLVKSFRHWFSQELLKQNAGTIDASQGFDAFPSLATLTAPSSSESEENNFGANIQNTQVFRLDRDFKNPKDIKLDSHSDMV